MTSQIKLEFQVHMNSLQVYQEKILPTLKGRKLEVYEAIKSLGGQATAWEVGQYLNRALNTFSGRLTELKESGHLIDTGTNKIHNDSPFSILKIA